MDQVDFKKNYRVIVEKIFNHWQNLRLAVEHGMGGRNGHQVAIDIMEYTYQYCINNENITQGELQDVVEELMDQEFDTICEDGSVAEICRHLLRYKQMALQGLYGDIELELMKLPKGDEWLRTDVKLNIKDVSSDSSSEESDDSMDVEMESKTSKNHKAKPPNHDDFEEPEEGWTTVRSKRK